MAIKKIEIRPKGDGTYPDVLYPKTSADMVEGLATEIANGTKITDSTTGKKYKFGVENGILYVEEVN